MGRGKSQLGARGGTSPPLWFRTNANALDSEEGGVGERRTVAGQAANPAHLGWSAVEGHAPLGTARLTTLGYDYGFTSLRANGESD